MVDQNQREPEASRPNIPYGLLNSTEGLGLLPWSRLSEKMLHAGTYWVATTRPDGRPHVMPVWGVWLDETFYFSTGPTTVNGRNLAANPAVVVHLESGEDVVILEGVAEETTEPTLVSRINDVYGPKYLWKDPIPSWYAVRPTVAFAWLCPTVGVAESIWKGSATRWRFSGD